MTVVPFPWPAVQSAEFSTPPDQLKLPLRQMTGYGGGARAHCAGPGDTSLVRVAPAPPGVAPPFIFSPPGGGEDPPPRETTRSAGHAVVAAAIWAGARP